MPQKILKMDNIPEKLLKAGQKRYFKKNQIIIHAGDLLDHVYILVKGKILVLANSKQGSLIYDFLLVPQCIIGESYVINQEHITATFKCLSNVEVLMISKHTLLDMMESDFSITKYLYKITSSKFENIIKQAREYATLSAESRIILILIDFAEKLGENIDGRIKINYQLSHQFISDFVGVTRLTTINALRKLEQNNLITISDGYYYLDDIDALKNFQQK